MELALSSNEYEIMSLLWREKRPMSKAEIVKLSTEKSWKDSSVYILLNSLLKKGIIKEKGFVKSQTNYGRTFSAVMTEKEYAIMQINILKKKSELSLSDLVMGMVDNETCSAEIEELESIINKKREERSGTVKER